ncbi:MAG: hypothetical protein PHW13_07320 [Methylococcales bacterium]|nr:hypothetical protein [Methylococcales bacterium]
MEKLDKPIQKRIVSFLQERIQPADNPRTSGKALQGKQCQHYSLLINSQTNTKLSRMAEFAR